MERIFINDYGYSHNWIMGKIADDIRKGAESLGYCCRCGKTEDYQGEEICYHLNFAIAKPIAKAKHNSVFYTHLNDVFQELNLVEMKDQFDSFICMSPEDEQYLIELGFNKEKVFGRILPVRNSYIKPLSIGIFSACYDDGRKNEKWLIDFCRDNANAQYVNFVFVGKGWDNVVKELEQLGCSFEWHNVSRKLPFEYQFQQNKLCIMDYYIYMGMDGGAMGTYDAYAQDIPLCITFDGFHKAIPDIDFVFDNKETFYVELSKIVSKHERRLSFFMDNNLNNYVRWIISVWSDRGEHLINEDDKRCLSYSTIVDKKREQYYAPTLKRFKNYLAWKYYKWKIK